MTEDQSKDGIWLTAIGLNKQVNRLARQDSFSSSPGGTSGF